MKPYGHHRRDHFGCKYGCCGFKGVDTHHRPESRGFSKIRRKTARQTAKREIIGAINRDSVVD